MVRGGRHEKGQGGQHTNTALYADINIAPFVLDQFTLFTIERFVGKLVRGLWPVFLAQHAAGLLSRRDERGLEAGQDIFCGGLSKSILRGRKTILAVCSPAVRGSWEERETFSGFLRRRTRNRRVIRCW